jgi:hypothetical protein
VSTQNASHTLICADTNWRAGLEEPNEEEMQAAIHKIMGKASTQMEDCVMASYLALLIGCLLRENEVGRRSIIDSS